MKTLYEFPGFAGKLSYAEAVEQFRSSNLRTKSDIECLNQLANECNDQEIRRLTNIALNYELNMNDMDIDCNLEYLISLKEVATIFGDLKYVFRADELINKKQEKIKDKLVWDAMLDATGFISIEEDTGTIEWR